MISKLFYYFFFPQSLWKFPLHKPIEILLKNGYAKDVWKMTNHHCISLILITWHLLSLHTKVFLYLAYPGIKFCLQAEVWATAQEINGHVYLAGVTIYFYFWLGYILSCSTTLKVMSDVWQLLLWIAFADLSSLQDANNPQGKHWRVNSTSVPILILN